MDPCEFNAAIAAITNILYASLSKEEFACLSAFLGELSRTMYGTIHYKDVCEKNKK